MKALLIAATLFAMPAYAGMSAEEASEVIEETAENCLWGTEYDGGPAISESERASACAKYEEAKNRLAELGIQE